MVVKMATFGVKRAIDDNIVTELYVYCARLRVSSLKG